MTASTTSTPTRGQVERSISQRIQALYREQLGHQPTKVTCKLADSNVVIVLENSITQPEQLLSQSGRQDLAEQVRTDLDEAIQPQLKALIEEILGIEVVELLTDATLETGRSGIIAVLAEFPSVRMPSSVNKAHKKRVSFNQRSNEEDTEE